MKNKGIHHISIISGDGRENANFYVNTLGLRMVLKTVNQDDPTNYHLFYANGAGQPGSSITFFPWPRAISATYGTGETVAVSFSVPENSFDYWIDRFANKNVKFDAPIERLGKPVLRFFDPDGLSLELIEDSRSDGLPAWRESDVPEEFAIRGFWGANFLLTETESSIRILTDILGFQRSKQQDNLSLLETESSLGHSIILEKEESSRPGRTGKGTVHHVAFRAKDEEELDSLREQVVGMGLNPTGIIDRHVFKSVYFQTPGGILFEIATDGPGYKSVVENEEELGKKLFLPPWLEPKRGRIEQTLPPIEV